MASVEGETLKDVFCWGYAGVMMGMMWQRSLLFNWKRRGARIGKCDIFHVPWLDFNIGHAEVLLLDPKKGGCSGGPLQSATALGLTIPWNKTQDYLQQC